MAITYRRTEADSLFLTVLKRRVGEHLARSTLPRHAGWPMALKTIAILATFALSYGLLLANVTHSALGQGLLIVVYHYAMFQMTIGIAHDATHGAYFGHPRGDAWVSRIFDLLGIDSRYWIQTHIHAHHAAPNVLGIDSAIEPFSLVRFHEHAPRAWFHRFQHFYIAPIYALVTVFQVFFLELFALRSDLYHFSRGGRSAVRLSGIVAKKLFVFSYSILIPVLIVDAPAWRILVSCLLGHVVCGLSLGLVFQTTHLSDATKCATPGRDGHMPTSYVRHVLETTADVAPDNALFTWLAGGLNIHVAHHLFPNVSQTHLPALARIVEDTSREFGMPYRRLGLIEAVRSHLALLARLGRAPRQSPSCAMIASASPSANTGRTVARTSYSSLVSRSVCE